MIKKILYLPLLILVPTGLLGSPQESFPALDARVLPPLTVVAENTPSMEGLLEDPGGYSPLDAKGATRTLAPVMETPVSEQVVSKKILNDQQTVYLDKALQNVSGVTVANSAVTGGMTSDNFAIRGFEMNNLTFEDGFRVSKYNIPFQRSMANVQDIEVSKGPASVLYGQTQPGGLVNIVSKKPLDHFSFSAQEQIASYNFYRETVDVSGPVDKNKTLLYRINLDQQNAGSFRDFINNDRFCLFPTLEWRPTHDDHAIVELGYIIGTQTIDNGIPFLTNGQIAPVSVRNNYAEPDANVSPLRDFWVKANVTHNFSDDLTLHAGYRTEGISSPVNNYQYYYGQVGQDGLLQRGYTGSTVNSQWTQEVLADITARFKTWVLKHEFLAGFDFFQQTLHYNGQYPAGYAFGPPINIYQPVYGQQFPPFDPSLTVDTYASQTSYGAFFQDQVELPWHFHALAGFRYDQATAANSFFGGGAGTVVDNPPLTPRFGLLWNPIKPVSFYASYTANYGTTALGARTIDGSPLPPQTAQQWEYGIKSEFLEKKLTTTMSFFTLTKENIPTTDPSNPLYAVPIGQARSRGLELQAAGEILPGWRIIGAYTYLDTAITQGVGSGNGNYFPGPSLQGLPLPGVPSSFGSLWTTYEIQKGPLKRLTFGAGVVGQTGSQAYATIYPYDADGNALPPSTLVEKIPGYAVVNLMAGYPFEIGKLKMTAQVNINNLFDSTYYSAVSTDMATPGSPINVMASLKAEF
jgi:iron complex outermembrane receptor protein